MPTETAKEMTLEDIKETIDDHVHAAKCAIEAGFDAVEIVSSVLHPSQIILTPQTRLLTGLVDRRQATVTSVTNSSTPT